MLTLSRIFACLIGASTAVGGCTTIEVQGADRVVQHRFGVLSIVPDAKAEAVVVRVRGAGLVPGAGGATLGYASETAAYLYDPAQCRVILFIENRVEIDAFVTVLGANGLSAANICEFRSKDPP